jgi:hypothetical protein
MPKYLSPFVTNEQSESARCFQPGEMDESEVIEFPEFAKLPTVYLAIRNVCVTLWNLNPKVNNKCIGLIKPCQSYNHSKMVGCYMYSRDESFPLIS